MAKTDFDALFRQLKSILAKYENELVVVNNDAQSYYLDTKFTAPNKKRLFFGAVKIMSKTVNCYLMPVYIMP